MQLQLARTIILQIDSIVAVCYLRMMTCIHGWGCYHYHCFWLAIHFTTMTQLYDRDEFYAVTGKVIEKEQYLPLTCKQWFWIKTVYTSQLFFAVFREKTASPLLPYVKTYGDFSTSAVRLLTIEY